MSSSGQSKCRWKAEHQPRGQGHQQDDGHHPEVQSHLEDGGDLVGQDKTINVVSPWLESQRTVAVQDAPHGRQGGRDEPISR